VYTGAIVEKCGIIVKSNYGYLFSARTSIMCRIGTATLLQRSYRSNAHPVLTSGAPPSMVALTDRFRSITAPMLSAALNN